MTTNNGHHQASSQQQQSSWFIRSYQRFHQSHEQLKHRVHTAWRVPLPPWGRAVMGFVYFSLPVVGGYAVMQWAISKSVESIGERGEKLKLVDQQEHETSGKDSPPPTLGGGVKLAESDPRTQENNKKMLEAFFRKERKRRRKQEKERLRMLQEQAGMSSVSSS
mmetsp:Transcript_49286/g.73513  ORF Transcript_49286/g.73513 Transcript_49286/m.73513 type:complete len:164 (-) Transcript_49286:120-611(-)|eukprot:CAMPEP_0194041224 /NCGR_PEP_ID=MMETSP0009_2-20130614/13122_1 /TAXON_ID=210454 /ORGANISM="Grammatophora oceanica, Strain CCMP 410" /LENGTH=163 /DNA_ID=CAMNT_0038684629 /DNA_START=187 /DNA_END=678 /DNA_ORIENTATION=+